MAGPFLPRAACNLEVETVSPRLAIAFRNILSLSDSGIRIGLNTFFPYPPWPISQPCPLPRRQRFLRLEYIGSHSTQSIASDKGIYGWPVQLCQEVRLAAEPSFPYLFVRGTKYNGCDFPLVPVSLLLFFFILLRPL